MAIYHFRAKRKPSGGLIVKFYRKTMRKSELGKEPAATTIGTKKLFKMSTKGGRGKTKGYKLRLKQADVANVLDSKAKKFTKAKILDVLENKANPHFVRLKIVTKGAIIKTEAGKARVTSRPGQHGVVNAILLEAEKVKEAPKEEKKVEEKEVKKGKLLKRTKKAEKTEK